MSVNHGVLPSQRSTKYPPMVAPAVATTKVMPTEASIPSDRHGEGSSAIVRAVSKPAGTSCEEEHYHNDWNVTSWHKYLIS